jgi:hypothetical protein
MGKTIRIPDGWHEVSVRDYIRICEVDENDHKTDIVITILAKDDNISDMDVATRNAIISHLAWTNSVPDDTFYKTRIEVDGEFYNMRNLETLLVGEWIDLYNFSKNPNENLHKMLSLLYKAESGENTPEKMLEAKVAKCYQALVFFSTIATNYTEIFPFYLMRRLEKRKKDLDPSTTSQGKTGKNGWSLRGWLQNAQRRGAGTASATT